MARSGGDKPGYRPDIDGLRAVAVLAVLLFHAELGFPGGFVGVDIFFVISGYLITRLIVAALERGDFTLTGFWTRRLKRIWPAASAMTLACLATGALLLSPDAYHQLATDAIPQTLMLANAQFARGADYFDIAVDRRILLHTWSLAVEEQFYLAYPFLLVYLWRARRHLLLPALVMLACLSLILSTVLLERRPEMTFYLLHSRAWELLAGGILSLISIPQPINRATRALVSLLALSLTLAPMFFYTRATPFPGLAAMPPCLGAAMLIHLGANQQSLVSRALAWEPVRRVGLVSYSLYLAHWPVLAFMRNITSPADPPLSWRLSAIVISFALAYLSWRFIERRFRYAAPKPRPFRSAVIRSALVSLAIIALSLGVRSTDGARFRFSEQILAHIDPKPVNKSWMTLEYNALDTNDLLKPIGAPRAKDSPAPPAFLLWGDSHAMAISELIDEQARQLGLSGMARIRPATSPIPGVWSATFDKQVALANDRVLQWVLDNHVRHVMLCSRWSVRVDGRPGGPHGNERPTLISSIGTPLTDDPDAARRTMRDALARLITTLEDTGVTVWILTEVPCQDDAPQQRAMHAWIFHEPLPTRGVDRAHHEHHTEHALWAITQAASPETRIIPLAAGFFDESGRSIIADDAGNSYYADDDHVNTDGAHQLVAPTTRAVLESIAQDRNTPP